MIDSIKRWLTFLRSAGASHRSKTARPKKFYKFTVISSRLFENLKDRKIWLSHPRDFNDPFDCRAILKPLGPGEITPDFIRDVVKIGVSELIFEPQADGTTVFDVRESTLGDEGEKAIETMLRYAHTLLRAPLDIMGAYCLSTNPYSILMWSHYGAQHAGVCLEFELDAPDLNRPTKELSFNPVAYSVVYPQISTKKLLSRHSHHDEYNKVVLTKSAQWSYEREWRLTSNSGGRLIDNPFRLTAVMLGAKISLENRKRLADFFKDRPDIQFVQAALDDEKFALYYGGIPIEMRDKELRMISGSVPKVVLTKRSRLKEQ